VEDRRVAGERFPWSDCNNLLDNTYEVALASHAALGGLQREAAAGAGVAVTVRYLEDVEGLLQDLHRRYPSIDSARIAQ
jgi:hypothetical protein